MIHLLMAGGILIQSPQKPESNVTKTKFCGQNHPWRENRDFRCKFKLREVKTGSLETPKLHRIRFHLSMVLKLLPRYIRK